MSLWEKSFAKLIVICLNLPPGITFRSQAFTVGESKLIRTLSCGVLALAQKLTVRIGGLE
jgi:hypothetical protein